MGSTKTRQNNQKQNESESDANKLNRIQKQIQSDLSPKFTEMKTGVRTSRFGRPQKEAQQDINSIPTEVARFVSKHSPKRLKPKETNLEECHGGEIKKATTQDIQSFPLEDKENFAEIEGIVETATMEVSDQNETLNTKVANVESQEDLQVEQEETDVEKISEMSENNNNKDFSMQEDDERPHKSSSDDGLGKQDFSDTDSALGSASSCHDIKNNNSEFVAGQILWGSFSKLSWFPCMAYPIDEEGNVVNDNGKFKQIHVKYFNWNGFTAFLPCKNAFEFKDIDDFYHCIKTMSVKKSRVKSFGKSCYKAMEEANFFKRYPLEERVKVFDEVLKHQLETKQQRKSLDLKSSRHEERKSIDSAVETGTAPSSPVDSMDPVESYLRTMEHYEAFVPIEPKKEKKAVPKLQAPIEQAPEIDSNRRKSNRAVKKRKFEDFEEEKPQRLSIATPVEVVESPVIEPKAKRAKILREETLEERFLVNMQDLRTMFHKVTKKRACMECLEVTSEPTHRCIGNGSVKCSGWFHESCSGKFEMKREEIRHQCGDSDEIIQTQAIKAFLTCKSCLESKKNCFACHKVLLIEDVDETQQCPNQECRSAYHKECLKQWPQTKISKGNNSKRGNLCPQHTCHTCFSKDIHNTGSLAKCVQCPAAYHLQLSCIPAGTIIISQTQVVCPRHPTEKEKQRNSKEKNSKPLNIDWCNICMESGNLVCCESCPFAFHPQCINYEESEENFHCVECEEGRLPLYNTIVWARVGAYRWWPGLIMPNHVVPESCLKSQKNDREFCIRFFGSYDYFWFSCERVFNYDGTNLSVKSGSSRLDSAFNIALNEAHQMAKLLESGDPQVMTSKPKPFTKILQNRPIPPVKFKKIDEHTQEKCSCSPEDPNPCSRESDCINMHLNFECNKLTCPAGARCQNQKLRNREYADVRISKTPHRGFGAFSIKDIPEDTFIIEYVGDLINTAELNKRMDAKIMNKEKDFYFLTIEGDLYVDAEPAGNSARFINHSCDPNCVTRKVTVDGNTRIGIFSNQRILANTELTFDYQMEFVGNKKTACFCGTPKCSGLIGEKPKEEKRSQPLLKKKAKKRNSQPSIMKISLQPPQKKRRASLETRDPMDSMLNKMVDEESQPVSLE